MYTLSPLICPRPKPHSQRGPSQNGNQTLAASAIEKSDGMTRIATLNVVHIGPRPVCLASDFCIGARSYRALEARKGGASQALWPTRYISMHAARMMETL